MTENHSTDPDHHIPETTPKRRFDSVRDAFAAGKDEGAAKAREKGPQLKLGICDLVHDVAYGVARYDLVPTGPSTPPGARHLEPAAGLDVVRVVEAIQAHQ